MWKRVGEFFDSRSGKNNAFWRWFPWVWLILGYCATMGVLWKFGRLCIDSDMAGEMVLANLLNQEGGLLSTNWWYSTEIRVFCMQILYRLGLKMFPGDWFAAQMVGEMLGTALLVGSYIYAARGLKLKNQGVWGAAALVCPFGICYLWYNLLGGFYLPHMIFALLGLGAALRLMDTRPMGWKLFHGLVLAGAAGASGLNGIKGIMGLFLPLVLTGATVLALSWHEKPETFPRKEARLLGYAAAGAAVAGAGYLFTTRVLANTHHAADFADQKWSSLDINLFLKKLADFFSLFGYPIDSSTGGNVSLFSVTGILGAVGLVTGGAVLFSLVRLLWRWRELTSRQRVAPILLAWALLVQGGIFAWTGTASQTSPYQWLTVVPLAFPVLQLEGETEHFKVPFTRRLAALGFCFCFLLVSVGTGLRYFTSGYQIRPRLEPVSQWLVAEGYTQGYATFWNGGVMTQWTNGALEMWVVDDFKELNVRHWLQSTSHEQPPEGEVFLLSTLGELEQMGLDPILNGPSVAFIEEGTWDPYVVLSYQSVEEMQAEIQEVLQLVGS